MNMCLYIVNTREWIKYEVFNLFLHMCAENILDLYDRSLLLKNMVTLVHPLRNTTHDQIHVTKMIT